MTFTGDGTLTEVTYTELLIMDSMDNLKEEGERERRRKKKR